MKSLEQRRKDARAMMRELGIKHLYDDKVERLKTPLPDNYETPRKQDVMPFLPRFLLKNNEK